MSIKQEQALPTTGVVESRLAGIELVNGYPTAETVSRMFDTRT